MEALNLGRKPLNRFLFDCLEKSENDIIIFNSENNEDIINAYKSFSYESSEAKIPIHMRLPFILTASLMLFIEWILVNTKYRTIP